MTNHKYAVTKQFVSGLLKGIEVTETTSVKFQVGKTYNAILGSSGYKVTKIVRLAD